MDMNLLLVEDSLSSRARAGRLTLKPTRDEGQTSVEDRGSYCRTESFGLWNSIMERLLKSNEAWDVQTS